MDRCSSDHRADPVEELAAWVRLSASWPAARLGEIGFPAVGVRPATLAGFGNRPADGRPPTRGNEE
jgi:hypothetical protein